MFFSPLCRVETMLRLVVVREHLQHDAHCDVIRRPHLYRDLDEIHDSLNRDDRNGGGEERERIVTSQDEEPGAAFLLSDSPSVDFDDVTRPFKGESPPDVAAASSADLVARSDDSSLDDVTTAVGGGFFGRNGFLGKKSLRRKQKIPESETEGANSKSLPNFRRASSAQVNPLKYPSTEDQQQEEEIPQLLVDGCYHGNVGCHEDLPDLYACNTLPARRPLEGGRGRKGRRSSQSTSKYS